ncbi:MAG: response regulator [Acidobacteriia bacterium]|nr:response regulator [Terriglobia bacterium]
MAAIVVALVEDLLFLSKIRETAKAVGVTVIAGDTRSCVPSILETGPQAILLDLNSRMLAAVDCVRALKADPATRQIPIVGFVSHVQPDLIAAARAAGCDLVLARSAFSQQLPDLLRKLASEAAVSPAD